MNYYNAYKNSTSSNSLYTNNIYNPKHIPPPNLTHLYNIYIYILHCIYVIINKSTFTLFYLIES